MTKKKPHLSAACWLHGFSFTEADVSLMSVHHTELQSEHLYDSLALKKQPARCSSTPLKPEKYLHCSQCVFSMSLIQNFLCAVHQSLVVRVRLPG